MKIIGITGGVGAGKSEILNFFRQEYGARVLLADEVAHLVMAPGGACYGNLQKLLPKDLFREDGFLDRGALAALLFADENLRSRLNSYVHPAVKEYIISALAEEQKAGTCQLFVIEAALLIEEKYDEICDELWYIFTKEEVRKKRLMESRGYSPQKIADIFASQLSEEEYRAHTQVVIDNNGTKEETFFQIRKYI